MDRIYSNRLGKKLDGRLAQCKMGRNGKAENGKGSNKSSATVRIRRSKLM